jgi:hypothetical protein
MSEKQDEEDAAGIERIQKTTDIVMTPEFDEKFGIQGTFYLYSVGMKENYNLPDLEIRGVPGMLVAAGVLTINELNAYRLISDKPILPDQRIDWTFGDIVTEQGDDWDGAYTWKAEDMIRLRSAKTDICHHDCECCQYEKAGATE